VALLLEPYAQNIAEVRQVRAQVRMTGPRGICRPAVASNGCVQIRSVAALPEPIKQGTAQAGKVPGKCRTACGGLGYCLPGSLDRGIQVRGIPVALEAQQQSVPEARQEGRPAGITGPCHGHCLPGRVNSPVQVSGSAANLIPGRKRSSEVREVTGPARIAFRLSGQSLPERINCLVHVPGTASILKGHQSPDPGFS
jgi:hypothetical protein